MGLAGLMRLADLAEMRRAGCLVPEFAAVRYQHGRRNWLEQSGSVSAASCTRRRAERIVPFARANILFYDER